MLDRCNTAFVEDKRRFVAAARAATYIILRRNERGDACRHSQLCDERHCDARRELLSHTIRYSRHMAISRCLQYSAYMLLPRRDNTRYAAPMATFYRSHYCYARNTQHAETIARYAMNNTLTKRRRHQRVVILSERCSREMRATVRCYCLYVVMRSYENGRAINGGYAIYGGVLLANGIVAKRMAYVNDGMDMLTSGCLDG